MVQKYVQKSNTIKDILTDILNSLLLKPIYKSLMNKLTFLDGFLVILFIYTLYLPSKILTLYLLEKNSSFLSDKLFWMTQISYLALLVILFLGCAFVFQYFYKKQNEIFEKWFYISPIIFIDSFVFMVFSSGDVQCKLYLYLKYTSLLFVSAFTILRIQANYRPGDKIGGKEKGYVFLLSVGMSAIVFSVLYWFGALFVKMFRNRIV
ncbi:hypothetical protein TUBRATIS_15080 [Tubulinosema ratisbonensis]|uniref:Uncharacterized protein n=1 Tax=Tubulinosema ratisbonensis TaxID=291195 RepID=A0A437ALJ1_9MICR|nr:hypothetical protein TUBRATIS_15080 [Tubulinosema ratisbonensis]